MESVGLKAIWEKTSERKKKTNKQTNDGPTEKKLQGKNGNV